MRDDDNDTTIGTGGWLLVGLSGVITYAVLRWLLHYHLFPSLVFALAIALVVLLVLHRLAVAVNRYDDEEDAGRVRKIVPASAEVGMRIGGGASGAVAVPARPEPVTPLRPSSVVTPLAKVEPAPIMAPRPVPTPAAPVMAEAVPVAAVTKATKPKAAATPKAEKSAANAAPVAKSTPAAKSATAAKTAPAANAAPAAKAAPVAKAAPAAKTVEKPAKAAAKPKETAKPKAAAKPKATKAAIPVGLVRLKAPLGGRADDLKEIEGIGPALEKMVNGMGFFHFDQIAAWTDADVALVDAEMKTFKGRITRDKWVAQARIIVTEGLEAFRERAKTNDY